jgi:hypothetical protein
MNMHEWLVEPLDAHANSCIAGLLVFGDTQESVLCNDGIRRDCWSCDYRTVSRILKSLGETRLNVRVFVRKLPHGKARPWFAAKPPVRPQYMHAQSAT